MQRLRFSSRRSRFLAVLLGVVAIAAAGSIAWADIPDSGVIHGCYQKQNGQLRVIDADKGGKCNPSEAALNWNQTGPTGPTGKAGAPATALWAVVNDDGTLRHGSHVASTTKLSDSQYIVTFDQDVSACAYEVTQQTDGGGFDALRMIYQTVSKPQLNADAVGVQATQDGGATPPQQEEFSLTVFC